MQYNKFLLVSALFLVMSTSLACHSAPSEAQSPRAAQHVNRTTYYSNLNEGTPQYSYEVMHTGRQTGAYGIYQLVEGSTPAPFHIDVYGDGPQGWAQYRVGIRTDFKKLLPEYAAIGR